MVEQTNDGHFWLGSLCREDATSNKFPKDTTAVSDIITLISDLPMDIPSNSYMLYLLEFYLGRKEVPVELDLICSFNDDGRFWAVFGGNNQYEFKMLPVLGHSYIREIISDPGNSTINYILNDINVRKSETFVLNQQTVIKGMQDVSDRFGIHSLKDLDFQGSDHFTGVEWHNKSGNEPFPIRYNALISLLQYGRHLPETKTISYLPYRLLKSNKDNNNIQQYPILFEGINIMKGCICYNVNDGRSNNGIEFSF